MSPDYGAKIGKAFEAIYQLHNDVSKLLIECDGILGGGKQSLFKREVVREISPLIDKPDFWMPYCVFRSYDASKKMAGLVEGVLIHFWDTEPCPHEPAFCFVQMKYHLGDGIAVEKRCQFWDVWHAYYKWNSEFSFGKLITIAQKEINHPRQNEFEWLKLYQIPLYSIGSKDGLQNLLISFREQMDCRC